MKRSRLELSPPENDRRIYASFETMEKVTDRFGNDGLFPKLLTFSRRLQKRGPTR